MPRGITDSSATGVVGTAEEGGHGGFGGGGYGGLRRGRRWLLQPRRSVRRQPGGWPSPRLVELDIPHLRALGFAVHVGKAKLAVLWLHFPLLCSF